MLDSDGSRFLLGDNSGFLRMLALVQVDDQVVDMSLERIGEVCVTRVGRLPLPIPSIA